MKLKVRSILLFTLFLFLFTIFSSYIAIPKEICVIQGKNYNFNIKSPLSVNVASHPFIDTNEGFNLENPLFIKADKTGEYKLKFDLLGVFPVNAKLKVVEESYVYPSGEICGVKILTDGVLVISTTNINDGIGNMLSPSKLAGISPGDFLTKANGEQIKNSKHFMKIIKANGSSSINLEYIRDGESRKTVIIPVKSTSGEYVLGMWVRDSTAGLGTLTYYTEDKNNFAALGHSITDVDTGEIMPIKDGDLVKSTVISYNKGEKGDAGELIGVFDEPEYKIGVITKNCEHGLYGRVSNETSITAKPIKTALKSEIKTGKAKILSTIENNIPEEFDVEIVKINKQNDIKGLIIKVTDEELIRKTGGIVQGMSGSPILQNGKIVGAVTHVFVNDPTRGYGIFIENMLSEAEKTK